jgi:protocatechuate 3,4-dioxygenase beta subunit
MMGHTHLVKASVSNHHPETEGLHTDLIAIQKNRRLTLGYLGAGLLMPLVGCGNGASSTSTSAATTTTSTTTTTTTTTTGSTSCSVIPSETGGPYPGDGTNTSSGSTSNALTLTGIQRSNITSSIAGATGVANGVALTLTLSLKNNSNSCASLAGYAIYLWHCDALGRYSLYSSGITGENYLRGLLVTDANGEVTFTTIVPGCYSGRWPHMHFEIFSSLASATSGRNAVKTSQLAIPQSVATAVYADSRYSGSTSNLAGVTLASDNVFSDGSTLQVASVTGSLSAGYAATLNVGIAA